MIFTLLFELMINIGLFTALETLISNKIVKLSRFLGFHIGCCHAEWLT